MILIATVVILVSVYHSPSNDFFYHSLSLSIINSSGNFCNVKKLLRLDGADGYERMPFDIGHS